MVQKAKVVKLIKINDNDLAIALTKDFEFLCINIQDDIYVGKEVEFTESDVVFRKGNSNSEDFVSSSDLPEYQNNNINNISVDQKNNTQFGNDSSLKDSDNKGREPRLDDFSRVSNNKDGYLKIRGFSSISDAQSDKIQEMYFSQKAGEKKHKKDRNVKNFSRVSRIKNISTVINVKNFSRISGIAASIMIFIIAVRFAILNRSDEISQFAYVSVDINPSLELRINSAGKVEKVRAMNSDAQVILADFKNQEKNLADTVNELIALSKDYGFIKDAKEDILVTGSLNPDIEIDPKDIENEQNKLKNIISEFISKVDKDKNGDKIYDGLKIDTIIVKSQIKAEAIQNRVSMGRYVVYKIMKNKDSKTLLDDVRDANLEEVMGKINFENSSYITYKVFKSISNEGYNSNASNNTSNTVNPRKSPKTSAKKAKKNQKTADTKLSFQDSKDMTQVNHAPDGYSDDKGNIDNLAYGNKLPEASNYTVPSIMFIPEATESIFPIIMNDPTSQPDTKEREESEGYAYNADYSNAVTSTDPSNWNNVKAGNSNSRIEDGTAQSVSFPVVNTPLINSGNNPASIVSNLMTQTPAPTVMTVSTNTPEISATRAPTIIEENTESVKAQTYNKDVLVLSHYISFKVRLINTGKSDLDIGKVKLRYYFTYDGNGVEINKVESSQTKVHADIYKTSGTKADRYVELSFDSYKLSSNNSIIISCLLSTNGLLQIFNQGDDYSFRTSSSYKDNNKFTAYISGNLSWGVEP
nr:cellulose binding domain-containing protein [Bacillota bacterium]